MPQARVNEVELYYEVAGRGFPMVWCHELAQDCRSWQHQVSFFSRRYRVITYNARGYPPSDVPGNIEAYLQDVLVSDLHGLLRHLEVDRAIVGGLSMGGSVALNFGLTHPDMAQALIIAGTGTGSTDPVRFRQQVRDFADEIDRNGMQALAAYARGPNRVQLLRKNPAAWEAFERTLMSFSPLGCALTLRGFPGRRPSVFELQPGLTRLEVPTLIICGDEDDPCLESSLFLKRTIPKSGLAMFPRTGHTLNLEEPELFSRTVQEFLLDVDAGLWGEREAGSGVGFLTQSAPPSAEAGSRS